jgi:glycerol-3-phosphate dehydrogenase
MFGSDAPLVQQIEESEPALAGPLDSELPYTGAEAIWAVRYEMARTVEDVLARRTRALFLNSAAALRMAPAVARLMAAELKQSAGWEAEQLESFQRTAQNYKVRSDVHSVADRG